MNKNYTIYLYFYVCTYLQIKIDIQLTACFETNTEGHKTEKDHYAALLGDS